MFLHLNLLLLKVIKAIITVNLSFSTPDRDRPVSVTKLWSQISHANRTLFIVPLFLN